MFVVCVNDFPFAVLNTVNEEVANKVRDDIQQGFDSRKKTGYHLGSIHVHLRNVPVINGVEDIEFPQWDNEQVRVK